MKNPNDPIGNQTLELPACSASTSCAIVNEIPKLIKNTIPNYSHQHATFLNSFISTDALHVSGGSSAHHQEHISVPTASGIVNCNDRVK